ncbi:MAG: nuclear transport factor 2 family protein [Solirubrobacterales bacterium]
MSEENVEIVERLRRGYEAFNRGDFDAALEMADPEIEFVRPSALSPVRGTDALRGWMEPDAFEEQVIEPLELRVAGNKVLVHQRNSARGAGSGVEVSNENWTVWTLNDEGLATRAEAFDQKAEALVAAGLSE